MKNLTKTTAFWLTVALSLLLFAATCWSAIFQISAPYWTESIGYFLLTYLCIQEFSKKVADLNPWMIGLAAALGQLLIQVPMRIIDFRGCFGSLMVVVSCFIAIVLAVVCYKDRRPYSFILSYIILTMFNCIMPGMWDSYVLSL